MSITNEDLRQLEAKHLFDGKEFDIAREFLRRHDITVTCFFQHLEFSNSIIFHVIFNDTKKHSEPLNVVEPFGNTGMLPYQIREMIHCRGEKVMHNEVYHLSQHKSLALKTQIFYFWE